MHLFCIFRTSLQLADIFSSITIASAAKLTPTTKYLHGPEDTALEERLKAVKHQDKAPWKL